jgi:hypothetical protein
MEPTRGSARRMPSGDMTSDVKRGERLFFRLQHVFAFVSRKSRSQLDRITPVGVHAVARLLRNGGGGDDPADLSLCRQIALEPGPTGSRFKDKNQVLGFRLQLSYKVINVGLPRANGAELADLSVVICGDIGHRKGVFVDIQPDKQRARVLHG